MGVSSLSWGRALLLATLVPIQSATALTISALPTAANTVPIVSCSTVSGEQLENGSFEDSWDGWSYTIDYPYRGTVSLVEAGASGTSFTTAADGSHYVETAGSSQAFTLQKTITGLTPGKTYTVSFNYATKPGSLMESGLCWSYIYEDSTSNQILYYTISMRNKVTPWTEWTYSWTPTASSHTLFFKYNCGFSSAGYKVGWDKFSVLDPEPATTCTTSYSTVAVPTATLVPSDVVTPIVTPSPDVTPSSTPLLSPSSSIPVIRTSSSSVVVPSSSPVLIPSVSPIPRPSSALPSSVPSSSPIVPIGSSSLPTVIPSSQPTFVSLSSAIPPQLSSIPTAQSSSVLATDPSGQSQTSVQATVTSNSAGAETTSDLSIPTGNTQSSTSPSGNEQMTTSIVLSTRTSTVTACPTSVTDCPKSSQIVYLTTETIVLSTTVCPVTALPSAMGNPSGSQGEPVTTKTFFTTRVSTIYECPGTVTDCPYHSKTASVTTETLVAGTTVYTLPQAQAPATATGTSPTVTAPAGGSSQPGRETLTTETVYSTRTSTIYACPLTVVDCPYRSKTASATTETLVIGTTVYPVPVATTAAPVHSAGSVTTETILTTKVQTVNECPPSVTDCPLDQKTASLSTETLVAGTTVYTVPGVTASAVAQPAPQSQSEEDVLAGSPVTQTLIITVNGQLTTVTATGVIAAPTEAVGVSAAGSSPSDDNPGSGSTTGANTTVNADSIANSAPSSFHIVASATETLSTGVVTANPALFTGAGSSSYSSKALGVVSALFTVVLGLTTMMDCI